VSRAQTLAKLQSLLSRVRSRAAVPRARAGDQSASTREVAAGAPAPAFASLAAEGPGEPTTVETHLSAAAIAEVAPLAGAGVASPIDAKEPASGWTRGVETDTSEDGVDVSVDMSTWTPPPLGPTDIEVEVDIDVGDAVSLDSAAESAHAQASAIVSDFPVPPASESAERLVVAQPVASDPGPEVALPAPLGLIESADISASPDPIADLRPEIESTRAAEVAEAVPMTGSGARDSSVAPSLVAPSDTLPPLAEPETSPQPAARAVAEEGVPLPPASSRRPLEPEDRLAEMAFGEGTPQPPRHTPPPESGRLPAAPPDEFDADVTGVREAVTLSRDDESDPLEPPPPPPLLAFVPQSARPVLGADGVVADVVGDAQHFAPATFTALLDATLAL